MRDLVRHVLLPITLCVLFSAAAYYFVNVQAMVFSLPLVGIVMARAIVNLAENMHRGMKYMAYAHLDGHYYSYLDIQLLVLEDEQDYCRWVPATEVRRIVGKVATDSALALTYPSGWRMLGERCQGHLRDDALMLYLAKERSPSGIKFKNWAARNIAFPARRQRERHAIHLTDPTKPIEVETH